MYIGALWEIVSSHSSVPDGLSRAPRYKIGRHTFIIQFFFPLTGTHSCHRSNGRPLMSTFNACMFTHRFDNTCESEHFTGHNKFSLSMLGI